MIQDDVKILTELIRIVNRYGPDSVSNLANRIKDPQYATELATALENAVAGASRTKVRAKSRSTNRVGIKLLNELKESDPQKQSVIAEFRDLLLSSRCLRSMGELRQFARMHNLSIGKASSRNAAIVPLLGAMSELPTPEIVKLLESMGRTGPSDRSLESWRNLIVRPRFSEEPAREEPK